MGESCFQPTAGDDAIIGCQTCLGTAWNQLPLRELVEGGSLRLIGSPGANSKMKEWLATLEGTKTGALVLAEIKRLVANGPPVTICYWDTSEWGLDKLGALGLLSRDELIGLWDIGAGAWTTANIYRGSGSTDAGSAKDYQEGKITPGTAARSGDIFVTWEYSVACRYHFDSLENPGAAMIGHELIHAIHFMRGEGLVSRPSSEVVPKRTDGNSRSTSGFDNLEEARTIGRRADGFLYEELSENSIRHELGAPLRALHFTPLIPSKPATIDNGPYQPPVTPAAGTDIPLYMLAP